MNTPKAQNHSFNNNSQPYFTPSQQTTQILNKTYIKSQNSNTLAGNFYALNKTNTNTSYPRPSTHPSLSVTIAQNPQSKQSGLRFSPRPSFQGLKKISYIRSAVTSRDQLLQPTKDSQYMFSLGRDPSLNLSSSKIQNPSQMGLTDPRKQSTSLADYQKKIANLQNQLKFQQKYANDLYKDTQRYKAQIVLLKQQNTKLLQRGNHIENQNNTHTDSIKDRRDQIVTKDNTIIHLSDLIAQKDLRISKLEAYSRSQNVIISDLNNKIKNFNDYYNNAIYEERIRKLGEEISKMNNQSNGLKRQNSRLMRELKYKNERPASVGIDSEPSIVRSSSKNFSPKASRESSPSSKADTSLTNNDFNQNATKMMNISIEQVVKRYQNGIDELNSTLQAKTQQNANLNQVIRQCKREVENIKEQMRIMSLKHSTQLDRVAQQTQAQLSQKQREIISLSQRLKSLQERYANARKQINEKDQFLKQYLIVRAQDLSQKSYIQQTIESYLNTFDNRSDLNQKVRSLQEQLSKYQKTDTVQE